MADPRQAKILIVITRLAVGGAPRSVVDVAAGLLELGYDVTIATGIPAGNEGSLMAEARSLGVRVEVVPGLVREIHPLRDPWAFVSLYRLIRRGRYDIVHTHISKAGVIGRLAARLANTPRIVHTYHGDVFDGYFGRGMSLALLTVERLAARCGTVMLAVSPQLASRLTERGIRARRRPQVVRNGIRMERFTGVQKTPGVSSQTVGAVAMFYPIKRLDVYVDVAREVMRRRPSVHFVLAGGGELEPRLRALAADLGDRFRFLGIRHDVPEVLRTLDVFVLTSDYEGAGIGVMEAMSAGVPVVATRAGGAEEIVEDGREGYLVPTGDVQAMADRVVDLLDNDEERERMGRAGVARARREFPIARSVNRLDAIYRSLMAELAP